MVIIIITIINPETSCIIKFPLAHALLLGGGSVTDKQLQRF